MIDQSLFLVIDEDGCLRNLFLDTESAEKFIANHGNESWTVAEDSYC